MAAEVFSAQLHNPTNLNFQKFTKARLGDPHCIFVYDKFNGNQFFFQKAFTYLTQSGCSVVLVYKISNS